MADEIKNKAEENIEAVLDGGQSITQGDMQVSKGSLKDSYMILRDEEARSAQRGGRRPLLRNINLGNML